MTKNFKPTEGAIYKNRGGGSFICLSVFAEGIATMQNVASGWTVEAHGLVLYDDASIEWDYSSGGHFEENKSPWPIVKGGKE